MNPSGLKIKIFQEFVSSIDIFVLLNDIGNYKLNFKTLRGAIKLDIN